MRKLLIIIAVLMLLGIGSKAYATQIMIDVGAAGLPGLGPTLGDPDTITGLFNQLSVYIETTSTPTGLFTFNDVGDLRVTDLLAPITPDDEGLGLTWELTGRWTNLTGLITGFASPNDNGGVTANYLYTGGTLNLYAHSLLNSNFDLDGGANKGSSDDDTGTFADGINIATLDLLLGTGSLDYDGSGNPKDGSTVMGWKFTYMLPNFWLDGSGNNLSLAAASNLVFAITDSNTDQITKRVELGSTYIDSNHDGSARISVVPEPTSMILLGMGLVGLAGLGRKKKVLA